MVLDAIALMRSAPPADVGREDGSEGPHSLPPVIHIGLVVPDARLFHLVKQRFVIVQPPYVDVKVQLHVLLEDKNNPSHDIPWLIRVALVESGLMEPEDVHLTYPEQVTLGWPKSEAP